jgi:uncharacterized protein YqgC (DUF456 family)
MINNWKKITLLASASLLILIGTAGLVLPLIPGFVLVIAGALLADQVYPELKNHPKISPLLNKLKNFFSRFKN